MTEAEPEDTSAHPALAPGHVALITGGASGIGLAVANRLAALDMEVLLVDQSQAALDDACAGLGGKAHGFVADVADRAAMVALAGDVHARFGPPSFLMNNAAIGGGGDVLSNPEGWARVLGVNLHGVLHGVQAFLPAMIEGGKHGLVVNTGSKQGITQPPGDTAYNVAKSGVKALTEGLAHSLRETPGCQVSAHLLIPGFTYTGMVRKHLPEKPAGAWWPEQVADFLLERIGAGDFYILCPDNEAPRGTDEKRFRWHMDDLVENRPALSRWHKDWKDAFARTMAGE